MGPNGSDDAPAAADADAGGEPVIDLSEPTDSGLSAPTVTPEPPPSDEVLVRMGVVGTIVGALGAGYLWRRYRRRRRSA